MQHAPAAVAPLDGSPGGRLPDVVQLPVERPHGVVFRAHAPIVFRLRGDAVALHELREVDPAAKGGVAGLLQRLAEEVGDLVDDALVVVHVVITLVHPRRLDMTVLLACHGAQGEEGGQRVVAELGSHLGRGVLADILSSNLFVSDTVHTE